jgi:hypothetical protein
MKKTFALVVILAPLWANAINGGGGGVAPKSFSFMNFHEDRGSDLVDSNDDLNNVDFVKIVGQQKDTMNVRFQVKPFDSDSIETHQLPMDQLNENYLQALKRSQISNQWERVLNR